MGLSKFYKKPNLSEGLIALYSHSIVKNIGMGLFGLFLPIFLFEKFGNSVLNIVWYYLACFVLSLFLVAPGAMAMNKIGLKKSMIWAIVFLTLSYLCFYFFPAEAAGSEKVIFRLAVISIITVTFYRMLFWIPYHTDFAKFTSRDRRGKQLSFLWAVMSLTSFIIPIASGFIIHRFGFDFLTVMVIILLLTSIFPLFFLPDIREKFEYSYWQSFRELFKKKNRNVLLAYGSDGAQGMVGAIAWPIFIYQLLNKEYMTVAIVSAIIIILSIIFQLATGQFTDKMDKKYLIRVGAILYSLGWLGKAFVQTGFHIFVAGTYHNFSAIMMRTPFDTLMYEKAADQGHYIDEYSVVREMAVGVGRVLMLLALLALFGLTSMGLGAAFVIAAAVSLLISFF